MMLKVLKEAGYEEALLGLALSFYDHKIPLLDWEEFESQKKIPLEVPWLEETRYNQKNQESYFWNNEKFKKAEKIALLLATKQGEYSAIRNNPDYIRAERKFLRSIMVWIYIQAPRCFWSEYDTYTVGVTKQSSSTMHTLDKRPVVQADFEYGVQEPIINAFNSALANYKDTQHVDYKNITILKNNLPEGWLQERVICTNYEVLRNILNQREGHRLKYWFVHNLELRNQLSHTEFLGDFDVDTKI